MIAFSRIWEWVKYAGAHEPFWIEIIAGVTTILWATFVFRMPLDLSDRQPYFVLASLASDETWEVIGLLLGATQLVMAAVDCRWGRWGVALLLVWWWMTLALGVYVGNNSAPGCVLYAMWGVADMIPVLVLFRKGYIRVRPAERFRAS